MKEKKENQNKFALFLSIIMLITVIPGVACAASNWYQFQMDEANSGVTGDEAPISNPISGDSMSWEITLDEGIDTTPIVVGNLVYVASGDNKVYAINKESGEIEWESSSSGSGFLISNLAYGNHMIFVPTMDGKIYAFDAESGQEKWSKEVSDKQLNTPVTYDSHKIYFGDCSAAGASSSTTDGTYYCYEDDGTELWSRSSSGNAGYYWAGAAVKGDYLIFGDDGSNLTSVNKDTGDTIDEIDASELYGLDAKEIRSSIMYNEGRIYFTSKAGYCYALGFNSDGTFDTSDAYISEQIGVSTSTPATYNERVYVGSNGKLSCLKASDLTEIWTYTTGNVQSSPALSSHYDAGNGDVYIYFTTNEEDGEICCLKDYDGNTGTQEQWSFQESGKTDWSLSGVAISDGWVYYGTDSGYLFGLTNKEEETSSSGGGGGMAGTGEDSGNIVLKEDSMAALAVGNRATYEFKNEDNCIMKVSFDPKKNAGYTTATVEVLKETSALAIPIEDEVYRYVNIWVGKAGFGTESNIENAEVEFRVGKAWIEDNGIDSSTIVLNRYNNDRWDSLDTVKLEEADGEFLYFRAETPGFSSFAITGEKVQETREDEVQEQETTNTEESASKVETDSGEQTGSEEKSPGFGMIFAILGLMASVFCIKYNGKFKRL